LILWCVTSRKKNATWAQQTTNEHDFFPREQFLPFKVLFFVCACVSPSPLHEKKNGKKIGGRNLNATSYQKSSLFFFLQSRRFYSPAARVSVLLHTHTNNTKSILIRSDLSTITMHSSSSSSFSLSFPRALKASRKMKSRERRRITPRSKKMSNRCFVNFAANGDDDDRAMVAAEQIATSKSTIDSSKVDFAMPNRLLSSDLTTVRFSFSQSARI
jgi:hypothetical protein